MWPGSFELCEDHSAEREGWPEGQSTLACHDEGGYARGDDVLSICSRWSASAHLDVDDIYRVPIFERTLELVWHQYEQPGVTQFTTLLRRLRNIVPGSAALVITRPPEIISVLKILVDDNKEIFVIFDSHPRSKHPAGAAFVFYPSLSDAAQYLSSLFQYDSQMLADEALQWQAQLLANYSGHVFIPRSGLSDPSDWLGAVTDSSLEVLSLKAEIADMKRRTESLQADNRSLNERRIRLEMDNDDLRDRLHSTHSTDGASTSLLSTAANLLVPQSWRAPQTNRPIPGPSSTKPYFASSPHTRRDPIAPPRQTARTDSTQSPRDDRRLPHARQVPPDPLTSSPAKGKGKGKLVMRTLDEYDDDFAFATHIQLEWQNEDDEDDVSATLVEEQRRKQQAEDDALREQLLALEAAAPAIFTCGICLEDQSEEMVARIESCRHEFCRDCLRHHIKTKLEEHRFPILCPICSTERKGEDPGVITADLSQQLGLTEQEYALYTELELAAFSTILHCRKCQQAAFVDKAEYEAENIIVCPLPGCNHTWCKHCSRTIEIGGPTHSCDGTSELNHLMAQRGWKYCPGCHTPAEKTDGCNHITCISPGCNTHFCYLCGRSIVQSVRPSDIKRALSRHYVRCRLIDDIPENLV
ncbi:hypothetical protein K474DRAFT_507336 [Panus rudis PR-1116 ss-1]|nr:hypothetical protein K474DRAFT_507336 [Panus rudis PR-1116 ss-1]